MKGRLVLILLCFLTLFLLVSCGKEQSPKQAMQSYIDKWQKKDFASMYDMLSSESKNTISQKDFTDSYRKIYEGIEASNISIKPIYPKEIKPDKKGNVSIPFTLSMDTAAGSIKFRHSAVLKNEMSKDKKQKQWKLIWNTGMIFPELGPKDKVRIDIKYGKRGSIIDRNGTPLAENGMIAQVGVVPEKLGSGQVKDNSEKKISQILGVTVQQIEKELNASYVKPYMFIPIKDISKDERDKINKLLTIPGVMVSDKEARIYPLKEKAAHLIGYVGPINADELKIMAKDGYTKDDIIGKTGLEKIYEKQLRPVNGAELYIIDEYGHKKVVLANKEAKNGKDIKLTIDSSIQSDLYDQLKSDEGAGIALNPKTGEVLALVSTPSYDPNRFILGISNDEWKALSENPQKPMLNRFDGRFAPGSSFKPITAAIALKNNKLDPNASKNITGLKWQKDKSWGNYFVTRVDAYNGPSNLLNALVYSDNIYFAQTALYIGKDIFQRDVKNFGIGEKLPFEYDMATSQLSSDGMIKNDIQLADSGYGQGQILMNPLHLATIYTAFVNNGNIIKPYLIYKDNARGEVWKKDVFSRNIANLILNDLIQVVQNPGGTGHASFISGISIAGKTGTAEIKQSQSDTKGTEIGWFVAMNTNNPKILVLAMAQDVKGKGGSHYVVPKVKAILEKYAK